MLTPPHPTKEIMITFFLLFFNPSLNVILGQNVIDDYDPFLTVGEPFLKHLIHSFIHSFSKKLELILKCF